MSGKNDVVDDNKPLVDDLEDNANSTNEKTSEELLAEIEALKKNNQEILGNLRKVKDQNTKYEAEKEKLEKGKLKEENRYKELYEKQEEKLGSMAKLMEEKFLKTQIEKTYSSLGVPGDKLTAAMDLSSDYLSKIEFDAESYEADADSLKSYCEDILAKYSALNLAKTSVATPKDMNPGGTKVDEKTLLDRMRKGLEAAKSIG